MGLLPDWITGGLGQDGGGFLPDWMMGGASPLQNLQDVPDWLRNAGPAGIGPLGTTSGWPMMPGQYPTGSPVAGSPIAQGDARQTSSPPSQMFGDAQNFAQRWEDRVNAPNSGYTMEPNPNGGGLSPMFSGGAGALPAGSVAMAQAPAQQGPIQRAAPQSIMPPQRQPAPEMAPRPPQSIPGQMGRPNESYPSRPPQSGLMGPSQGGPQPLFQPTGSIGDRLMGAMGGFAHGGSVIGGLSNAITTLATGEQTDPRAIRKSAMEESYRALVESGMPEQKARLAILNPAAYKVLESADYMKQVGGVLGDQPQGGSSEPQGAGGGGGSSQPDAGGVPGLGNNPAAGNIKKYMMLMAHPGIDATQKKGFELALQKELDNSKLPDHVKEYLFYAAQSGRNAKPIQEWDLERRRAQATLINTSEGMDAAQTKARIAIDTHAIEDLGKKAVAGRSALPLLNQVIKLASSTPGGWAGSASPTIARALSGMGLEVPEGLSNAELLSSISRQLIPSVRDPGATSNLEQQLYASAVPGLSQSQEGRVKIAEMFKAQIQRNSEILQIYRENIGSPDIERKLNELAHKPMFSQSQHEALKAAGGVAVAGNDHGTMPSSSFLKPGERPISDPLSDARSAIDRGASRDAVIKRLRQNGIDPTGL